MAPKRISKSKTVVKRPSASKKTVKRMSPKKTAVKRKSSVKRSSKKRMSNKKKLAIASAAAAGSLATILAGRALYKNKEAVKAKSVEAKGKVAGFFENLRARFAKPASENKEEEKKE